MADDAGALLVRSGLVSTSALEEARVRVLSLGGTVGEQLVAIGAIGDDALTDFYRSRLLVPQVNPNTLARLPMRVVTAIPSDMAIELRAIPVALDVVGLSSRMRHMPSQLSGGQQQRAAIARALAGDPRFLLADEPTGNVDSLMARQVMDLLEQINEMGTIIIMVTHDPELARRAHRHIHIVDGQISDFKPYETVAQDAPASVAMAPA